MRICVRSRIWQVLIIWVTGREHVKERVWYNDKKLWSSNRQCNAAQNPLCESWNCASNQAESVCVERSPATLVITLLGYETPNVPLMWKWDFTFGKKKKKRKEREERKRRKKEKKSQENSQSLVLFPGIRGTEMTSPAAYQSSPALFSFRSHVIIADVAQKWK